MHLVEPRAPSRFGGHPSFEGYAGRVPITQDLRAFVERLDVVRPDKRTEKQRQRVAEARVQTLEILAQARLAADVLRDIEGHGSGRSEWDARALRSDIESLRRRAAKRRDRAQALEGELRVLEARARHAVTFRLHSADHFVDLAEAEYERLSIEQWSTPVFILRRDKRQWWWFHDRFWWDDANLGRREVASEILESDLDSSLERHLLEETREVVLRGVVRPTDERVALGVQRVVWQRNAGRCSSCGSFVDLRFELVAPEHPGEYRPEDVDLCCGVCSALRAQHGSGFRRR
jgi:hypothetical protein